MKLPKLNPRNKAILIITAGIVAVVLIIAAAATSQLDTLLNLFAGVKQ